MSDTLDSESLIEWFEEEKRDLPWRVSPSPYGVWVSEVMLQQTQVSVVIPYYERWMRRFPTVEALSRASLDEVIKLWEGLGYYSRARNLLEGAKIICEKYGGMVPGTKEELATIKGLGPYTVGAILSFAFHQRAAAVDGNVLRVLARYFQLEEDISKGKTAARIRDMAEQLLPHDRHWIVNEALIELGATICKKTPKCGECPLRTSCKSFRNGVSELLPIKSAKGAQTPLFRAVAIISCGGSFLVRRGERGKIMHDLHEFPYFETEEQGISKDALSDLIEGTFGLRAEWARDFSAVSHAFTRYRVKLEPRLFMAKKKKAVEGYDWKGFQELGALAFSAGHKKILQALLSSL